MVMNAPWIFRPGISAGGTNQLLTGEINETKTEDAGRAKSVRRVGPQA
jgi:hypothetical protein